MRPSFEQGFRSVQTGNSRQLRGAIAQLGERLHGMQEVGGSIPPSSTNNLRFYPKPPAICACIGYACIGALSLVSRLFSLIGRSVVVDARDD